MLFFRKFIRKTALCCTVAIVSLVFFGCNEASTSSAEQGTSFADSSSSNSFNAFSSTVQSSESNYKTSNVAYGEMTDYRDGHTYKTIVIGTQTWMAENLNYADSVRTPSLVGQSWCYGNIEDKCKTKGRLYTWAAAIDSVTIFAETSQECGSIEMCDLLMDSGRVDVRIPGICPDGWHLPNYSEWQTLIDFAGGETAGQSLKSDVNWDGLNATGFSAIPSGCYKMGFFDEIEHSASFWSSSTIQNAYVDAIRMNLTDFDNLVSLKNESKLYGLSVRCIKD